MGKCWWGVELRKVVDCGVFLVISNPACVLILDLTVLKNGRGSIGQGQDIKGYTTMADQCLTLSLRIPMRPFGSLGCVKITVRVN